MQTKQPHLTLSPDEMRGYGEKVLETILTHFSTLPQQSVTAPAETPVLRGALGGALPRAGMAPEQALGLIQDHVFANMTHPDHPRNFSFVPSPSNFVSAMADALASSFNVFSGGWLGPSGVAEVEMAAIDWLRQIFGHPKTGGGLFVSGGSMASLTALICARHVKLKNNIANATVYFSDQTHSSVPKGLKILGFRAYQARKIPAGADFRLNVEDLRKRLDEDRSRGMNPFCVIANAGTTNVGAVDPLDELADFCQQEDLWLHVDAAYGGGAMLTERGKNLMRGIERADSVTVDPHKWFFQPYEIGCVLVKDRELLKDTFRVSAEYLEILENDQQSTLQDNPQINFYDYGVQLTRSFRALKLWMSMKVFGLDAMAEAVEHGNWCADYIQTQVDAHDYWQTIAPAGIGIVNFRYVQPGMDEEQLNALNLWVAKQTIHRGYALIAPTTIRGTVSLRMCCTNPRTTREDLDGTLAHLKGLAEEYLAQ